MKSLIIYDSVFGNTEKIAAAIAGALDAKVLKVSETSAGDLADLTLLIVGSPTRAFYALPSVTNFIKGLEKGSLSGIKVAAFDTRADTNDLDSGALKKMMKTFGYAAEPMLKNLVKKGGIAAADPAGFYVADSEGPLKGDEETRAVQWATAIEA